jgi:hypothetical protein
MLIKRQRQLIRMTRRRNLDLWAGCVAVATLLTISGSSVGQEWSIPVAGNAFRTEIVVGGRGFSRDGVIGLSDANEVISIYFHVDRPSKLELSLEAAAPKGPSDLDLQHAGKRQPVTVGGADFTICAAGQIEVNQPGYVRVDVRGTRSQGRPLAELKTLFVRSKTPGLQLDFVKTNDGNMFYWGRRGPSVHLSYLVPPDVPLEYAYSEIRVEPSEDPIGSYFMANGFAEGYFGIQVNSERERRVLFSIWSPFQTDNPQEIPVDQRIEPLARGPEVHIGEFGNEGSGGQSYLIYPWQAGRTYRFLTQVTPDGNGSTIYTSWFGDKEIGEWRLIASFRRPQTDSHLKGFHSFLESFDPDRGHLERRGFHGNIWVCDSSGNWHECTRARFSVDATGQGHHRLDFTGGAQGQEFFLRNCGFFSETGNPGELFTRESSMADRPEIDFTNLPRE